LVEEINTMDSEIMVHLECGERIQQITEFILSKGEMTIHKLKRLYPDLELISPGIMLYAFECVK
jgi:hypothetical protein